MLLGFLRRTAAAASSSPAAGLRQVPRFSIPLKRVVLFAIHAARSATQLIWLVSEVIWGRINPDA
jgi:hypothetical protein